MPTSTSLSALDGTTTATTGVAANATANLPTAMAAQSNTTAQSPRDYKLVEIVASLEIGTSIRWDSIQSWLEQAVAVLLRAISKHLEAPEVWDGRQIVLASGGRIQSSSSASNVEINLNVLVPPTSNLSSNSRRLVSTELVN